MRQVPPYAIVGAGHMARHFCYYLEQLAIPYRQWSRQMANASGVLSEIIDCCNPILLLINDEAIEPFIKVNPNLKSKTLVHFSGQLVSAQAYSAHPLMTFAQTLYPLTTYQHMPFIIEKEGPEFSTLLPGLANPHFAIAAKLKPFYHSLCVLSGNFTVLLWQKFFKELENTFHIPAEYAFPYLQQVCINLKQHPQAALTGPLVRGDLATIAANLAALSNDPFQNIYQAFVELFSAGTMI
jgi:hypothetical protein